ncbi:fructosamine kinase [Actinopolyspora erythraea]|uniref:Fructosamine kinase n=1 Tax=Actinopolyspora erythraea TaxID=414996 RepID=A0A099D0P1_9ACTN|nr:fructosamine kinase family protein [Actinopolyspora erythraea]ASU78031.1 fructosamine kinase [Actinopolyspora erythraea]KGI79798.1 fructosamine kinase [Actinopolyspora erythraea]
MSRSPAGLAEAVAEFTGASASTPRRLGGGDASTAYEVPLADGRSVFAKAAPPDMPGALRAEAASLHWLAEPGAVRVPRVHGDDERWLVTEHVAEASPTPEAADEFGRSLARTHAAGAPAHGCPPPGGPRDAWIGLAPMRDEPVADWPTFYGTLRVEPYVRRLVDSGTLRSSEAEPITGICERLGELPGADEPPARLHGDLWSGNVHWGRAPGDAEPHVWVIDPAAHGGHRETDLAMLRLFGCPHLERVLAAYEEESPLAAGWRDRVGLHQLFPLLVHGVLFGRSFATRARAAAEEALRLF